MTALAAASVRHSSIANASHTGLTNGLLSVHRKITGWLMARHESPVNRRPNARARAATMANAVLREHGSVWPTTL